MSVTLHDLQFLTLYANSLSGNFGEYAIEERYDGYRMTQNGRAILCEDYKSACELKQQMEAYILGMKSFLLS